MPRCTADELSRIAAAVHRRKYESIRAYAEALILLVRVYDDDGREIGFDYEHIRNFILRKYPRVRRNGPHKDMPTRMPYKELQEFACDMNRRGIRLPFRPRRKTSTKRNGSTP